MSKDEFRVLLISNFNVAVFANYLNNDEDSPFINATAAPFGQVVPVLIDKNLECWEANYDYVIVWTQPESVIESFKRMANYQNVSVNEILDEVNDYYRALTALQDRVKCVFIPTWLFPTYRRGYGMLEMENNVGLTNVLMRMNLRLSENLEQARNFYLLDAQKWIEVVGRNAFDPKLWFMSKVPFGNQVFKEATKDVKAALKGITGNAKKLIILDLDDTLWGGIVGEVGWEKLRLGGHNYIGEAYVGFQKALKALCNRGVLLGIVSKNDRAVAIEAINKHPEMILKMTDFAGCRINWQDKAKNIIELAMDLNIGLQSTVFIDDNPVEQARVRETLREVYVPEWPEDKMLYEKTLLSLTCFDTPSISQEDIKRTQMYATEQQRQNMKSKLGSLDEWLKTLQIEVVGEVLNEINLQRASQLLNKTNQMNLSTRRMTESELLAWARQDNHKLWTFRVSDKFGDSGLTGILGFEISRGAGRITDFLLSCRVIGRKVEQTMLHIAVEYARLIGLHEVQAKYIETSKNKPCLEFWQKSGFGYDGKNDLFKWDASNSYPVPECIHIRRHSGCELEISCRET